MSETEKIIHETHDTQPVSLTKTVYKRGEGSKYDNKLEYGAKGKNAEDVINQIKQIETHLFGNLQ